MIWVDFKVSLSTTRQGTLTILAEIEAGRRENNYENVDTVLASLSISLIAESQRMRDVCVD